MVKNVSCETLSKKSSDIPDNVSHETFCPIYRSIYCETIV